MGLRISWFSCRTIGCVDRWGAVEFVPCASLSAAEGWEAGTGPTMIGRITDAGIAGIDDTEEDVIVGPAGVVPVVICDVKIEREELGCADEGSAGPGDVIEMVCCEGSTLTVGSDADSCVGWGAASFLNTKGVDVRGGGSGVPFGSPRTLRLKGGSSVAVDLPFRPPTLASLPPAAALVAARASCSSNIRSLSASTVQ